MKFFNIYSSGNKSEVYVMCSIIIDIVLHCGLSYVLMMDCVEREVERERACVRV